MNLTANEILHCRGLYRRHESSGFELGPVTFSLDKGITCLVGLNGAGKTTLLRMLAGITTPDSGEIAVQADRVGYVPQDLPLPAHPRCGDYLEYAAWVHAVDRDTRSVAAEKALAAVDLSDRSRSRIGRLSGGMKRRIAIAQALVHEPQLLVVDEPMNGLDPDQRLGLRSLFVDQLAPTVALIVSTHLVDDVEKMADRAIVLRNGKIELADDVTAIRRLAAAADLDFERYLIRVMTDGV